MVEDVDHDGIPGSTRRVSADVADVVNPAAEASKRQQEARKQAFQLHVLPEIDVLFRVAASLTGQRADAEDLVQDTLARAWRGIDTFDGRHSRPWLLTILRNTHINSHRRQRPGLLRDPDTAELHTAGAYASAEDSALENTFDAVVASALTALSEPFRQVVLLVDVDGLTYTEAATLLGVPEGTVMSRLHRGRRRIRVTLAAAGLAPRRRM